MIRRFIAFASKIQAGITQRSMRNDYASICHAIKTIEDGSYYTIEERRSLNEYLDRMRDKYRDSQRLVGLARRCGDENTKEAISGLYSDIEFKLWGDPFESMPELAELQRGKMQ